MCCLHGEIDACMLPEIAPKHFQISGVRRLWPNFRDVEKEYYLRTKIFPDSPRRGGKKFHLGAPSMGQREASSMLLPKPRRSASST